MKEWKAFVWLMQGRLRAIGVRQKGQAATQQAARRCHAGVTQESGAQGMRVMPFMQMDAKPHLRTACVCACFFSRLACWLKAGYDEGDASWSRFCFLNEPHHVLNNKRNC